MQSKLAPLAITAAAAMVLLAGCSGNTDSEGGEDQVTLTFESWRTEDAAIWEDQILPVFYESHPNIRIEFSPTLADDYDAALRARFEGGTAGDLITCRSGSRNLATIDEGFLEPIDGLSGLDNFSDLSLSYFGSAEGDPYCVPAASVMAAFFYNKAIFDELGLSVPTTIDEFHTMLQKVKDDGTYTPLAYGTANDWILTAMGIYNVGPNYWQGEDGRQGLIDGTKKFTDPEFVAALEEFSTWSDYMPNGFESLTYTDAQQMFALGQGAVFPSGSWDITAVTANGLDIGVFAPPVQNAGDQLYVQSHPDMAIGINAASEHKAEAEVFLEWIATPEFGALYADALPGFFPMIEGPVTLEDPLAQAWSDLKDGAELTPRVGQFQLSTGEPTFESQLRQRAPGLLTGNISPADTAAEVQASLESWYAPQQG